MAVRRTSGLPAVISTADRRIKDLESSQNNLDPNIAAITVPISDSDNPDLNLPDETSGVDKKYEFKRVLKAYIYGGKVTGFNSRCELYFAQNPEIAEDDPVNVQGVHGTSTDNFEISPKNFKVFAVDSFPWTDDVRITQPWRNTPTTGNNGETITNTVWFNPAVEVPSTYSSTSGRELVTTRRIDSASVVGNTVTVALNSAHLFEVGDIISVDLPTEVYGRDGLFEITAVPDNETIVYQLENAAAEDATFDSFASPGAFVYPVARRYVRDGTVWIDKSVTPNRVWVWNKLRWYDTADPIGDVAATKDGIAPSPVTDLTGVTSIPSGLAYPVMDLSWTPPTTRSNGDPIANYLDGYEIWYKKSTDTDAQWKKQLIKDGGEGISVHRISDPAVEKDKQYNIRVYVVDIMAQLSTPATINIDTPSAARPSPVTNLAGTSTLPSGTTVPVINLTWTPPTTRVDGGGLAGGIAGYEVWFKRAAQATWTIRPISDGGQGISSFDLIDASFSQNSTYNIRVYVLDTQGLRSDAASIDVMTSKYSDVLNAPSTPIVTSRLRTITVRWDGKDSANNLPVLGVIYIEFHESTTSGFTPSASTLVQSAPITNSGATIVLTGRQFSPLIPNTAPTYYYKTKFVRQISETELVDSAASTQSTGLQVVGVTGPDIVANSITVNEIDAGYITAALVRGDVIRAGASASSARVEITEDGINAYTGNPLDQPTFTMSSATGSVVINGGSLTSSTITGGTIQTTSTSNRGVKINSAGLTAFSLSGIPTFTVTADSGAVVINGGSLTSPTITGGILQTTATAQRGIKIENSNLIAYNSSGVPTFTLNGSNGHVTISGGMTIGDITDVQNNVEGVKTNIYSPGTTEINGGRIRTGTIFANAIGSGTFPVGVIYAGNINANSITSGTINAASIAVTNLSASNITSGDLVGRIIRTVPAGNDAKRIILNTAGEIVFFNSNSSQESGKVEATNNGLSLTTRGSTQLSFDIGGSQIAYVSSSGMGFNGIDKRWIGSLSATGGLQAGNGNAIVSSNGNITGETITAQSGLSVTGSITGTSNCTVDNRFRQFAWSWAVNPGTTAAVHRATTPAGNGAFEGFFGPTTSDARFKENVEELQDSLSIINQLRPVKYNFISESESPIINYGLIAQEVRPLFEENSNIVNGEESDTDYLSIEYIQLIAPMVKAIQELSAKNDALEARLAALEGNG